MIKRVKEFIGKSIEKMIVGYHKNSKRSGKWPNRIMLGFMVFCVLFLILGFIFLFIDKYKEQFFVIFGYIENILILFFLILLAPFLIKQISLEKKEEKQKFGILYKKLSNDKQKEKNVIKWLVCAAIIMVLVSIILSAVIYKEEFYKRIILGDISDNTSDNMLQILAYSGDYIGGTIGTLLTALMFLATLLMIYQQGQEIEISQKELKKQQFEKNFDSLLKEINQYKSDNEPTRFYSSLRSIYQQLEEYNRNQHSNDRNFIFQKHNYIIKSNLDKYTLYKIFTDDRVQNAKYDDYTLFSNIKKIIGEYRLFENIIDIDAFSDEQKQHIFDYPLLSYFGNHSIIKYIFQQIKKNNKNEQIKSYIESSIYHYRFYAINEENPIIYLSLIMYDEYKKFYFLSTLSTKLKDIEFSSIRNRNLFLLECITYVLCDIRLYNKYPKTVECVVFKMINFLEQQVNDSIYRSENIIQFIYHFANHIREINEQNRNKINTTLTKILLDILKEKQYPISTTLLLNEIITIHQGKEWNESKNTIKEFYDTLNENEKPIETEYEKIQMYRNNKQNLIEYIDKNKEKLHIPLVKKWRIFRQSKL